MNHKKRPRARGRTRTKTHERGMQNIRRRHLQRFVADFVDPELELSQAIKQEVPIKEGRQNSPKLDIAFIGRKRGDPSLLVLEAKGQTSMYTEHRAQEQRAMVFEEFAEPGATYSFLVRHWEGELTAGELLRLSKMDPQYYVAHITEGGSLHLINIS